MLKIISKRILGSCGLFDIDHIIYQFRNDIKGQFKIPSYDKEYEIVKEIGKRLGFKYWHLRLCKKGWKLLDEILTNANYINCKNISTIIILCILS